MAAYIQLVVYCDGKDKECEAMQVFKTTDSIGEITEFLEKAGWESRPTNRPNPLHFCPNCRKKN